MRSMILFFKQKTAYGMRISDWSSDVCSSDLLDEYIGVLVTQPEIRERLAQDTADFQRTMDDEGLARQQTLRAMDEDLTRRLAALSESSSQKRPANALYDRMLVMAHKHNAAHTIKPPPHMHTTHSPTKNAPTPGQKSGHHNSKP